MASPPSAETETEDAQQPSPIPNPRRLLILSTAHHSPTIIPPFLENLTGAAVTSLPAQPSPPPPPQPASNELGTSSSSKPEDIDSATPIPIPPPAFTFAGYTSHSPLRLETKYYTADIPIWVDEVPYTHPTTSTPAPAPAPAAAPNPQPPSTSDTSTDSPSHHPSEWKNEFLGSEARVVRDAIGAIIVCLPTSPAQGQGQHGGVGEAESLKCIVEAVGVVRDLMEEERGGMGDVPGMVVLVGKREEGAAGRRKSIGGEEDGDTDGEAKVEGEIGWWEESLLEMGVFGWEVVVWDPKEDGEGLKGRRNQYGELEGLERVKEVLEASEWASPDDDDDEEFDSARLGLLSNIDEGDEGFNLEVGELEREMLGLKMAIGKGGGDGDDTEERDEERQVEELEGLMLKMQAVKEKGAEMPESERRKFAIKAVRDILKDI